MVEVRWESYPHLSLSLHATSWLQVQANLQLAPKTIDAYGRSVDAFIAFCVESGIVVDLARREHIAAYVRDLATRPNPRGGNIRAFDSGAGLANATLQLRLTAVRLFFDYLMEEGIRSDNPVGRGRYTPGKGFGGERKRGLIPRYRKLPWIPNREQWQQILNAARQESLRNRLMLALAYDGALRREELCVLGAGDIDPAHRTVRIRAETTKNRRERVVIYSEGTGALLSAYLRHRRGLSRASGPLFVSESHRNRGQPLSLDMWSKVVEGIRTHAGVLQFTTHTPRHLRLTDLARAGWDIHEIAIFAGHRTIQSTLLYIHLSGRDLAAKLERAMTDVHSWQAAMLEEPNQ
jgi:site-specific recombinase XerD